MLEADFPVTPDATVWIDLSPDSDQIMKNMKSKTRYNIRYAKRNDMEVFVGGKSDVPKFYELMSATAERQGFSSPPVEYFEYMYDLFDANNHIRLLFAKHEEMIVSSIMLIAFGETVIYKRGGWSGEKGNLRPNELLHWTAIQWAKEQGYRYYDFEGIGYETATAVLNGEPIPDEAMNTPARFKIGFGGEVKLLPRTYCVIPNPLCHGVISSLLTR